jgi:hypothetical protein
LLLLITVASSQPLRKLGLSTQRRIILETCTVKRRQDKIFQALLLITKKLKRKNYQPTVFVCGMKSAIVHGKKTKQVRTMRMGVTMAMNVVDHRRELKMGATISLGEYRQ